MQNSNIIAHYGQKIRIGAVQGLIAWTVYAIIECSFSVILPWIFNPNYLFVPAHWLFTLFIFVLYPSVGLFWGGLFGYFLRKRTEPIGTIVHSFTIFSILLIFSVNIVIQGSLYDLSVLFTLMISLVLTVFLILRISGKTFPDGIIHYTDSIPLLLLLVGPISLTKEIFVHSSLLIKLSGVVIYLSLVILGTYIFYAKCQTNNDSIFKYADRYQYKKLLPLLCASTFVIILSVLLKQEPIVIATLHDVPAATVKKPNVILIVMDTVRADHCSNYNYFRDTTPNLMKLSEKATLYNRAISTGDYTLSAHASIFSGQYSRTHGAHPDHPSPPRPLDQDIKTLTEILSENGYYSMANVSNIAFITKSFGFQQGFDFYDQRGRPRVLEKRMQQHYLKELIRSALCCLPMPREFELKFRRADEINNEVYSQLEIVKKHKKPFFLFLNYMDAHRPYVPPPPFDKRYLGDNWIQLSQKQFDQIKKEVLSLKRNLTEKERSYLISQYDGGIAFIDHSLGEFFGHLKKLEMYDNSLIIITSDHGEAFGRRNFLEHGCSVFQDQIHIPLIIKFPNVRKRNVNDKLVSLIDIMPTILDVVGINENMSEDLQGRSLISADLDEPRDLISESFALETIEDQPRLDRIERAIFSGPYKYIESTIGKQELYDLKQDPDEYKNIIKSNSQIYEKLKGRLDQWLKNTILKDEVGEKVDQESLDRLKTLGYI